MKQRIALLALLCACAHPKQQTQSALAHSAGSIGVEDAVHGVRYELPPAADGWQASREGSAHLASGVQVDVANFPMPKQTSATACRDLARQKLSSRRAPASAAEAADSPHDESTGDSPTATWSFTRGPESASVRSRWAFYARGADCLMLEVTGPLGDRFAESTFATAARSMHLFPLPPERQREVDLLAGMGFLERREPSAALERFEALSQREPDFSKAHFGALMAGFELGPGAYARALPHGEAALKADRDLTGEQRQLALRAVGVMQLAENRVRNASTTLAELVVRAPDLAEGQYNYACALARLGDREGALQHLTIAVKLDGELASHARDDEDLKALRPVRAFQQLVGTAPPPPSAERK